MVYPGFHFEHINQTNNKCESYDLRASVRRLQHIFIMIGYEGTITPISMVKFRMFWLLSNFLEQRHLSTFSLHQSIFLALPLSVLFVRPFVCLCVYLPITECRMNLSYCIGTFLIRFFLFDDKKIINYLEYI